jgi:hypothetical protein
MPAADGGATGSGGRRPKASKGRNRDGERMAVARALWGFGRGGARGWPIWLEAFGMATRFGHLRSRAHHSSARLKPGMAAFEESCRRRGHAGASVTDPEETSAHLLDHILGACQQPDRKYDPERLCGFEVEGQFDPYGLLDRHIGRFVALENAAGVGASQVRGAVGAAIAHQAAGLGVLTVGVHRGQRMVCRQRQELFRAPVKDATAADQDPTNALLRKSCEGRFEIASAIRDNELYAQYTRRRLQVYGAGRLNRMGRVPKIPERLQSDATWELAKLQFVAAGSTFAVAFGLALAAQFALRKDDAPRVAGADLRPRLSP